MVKLVALEDDDFCFSEILIVLSQVLQKRYRRTDIRPAASSVIHQHPANAATWHLNMRVDLAGHHSSACTVANDFYIRGALLQRCTH